MLIGHPETKGDSFLHYHDPTWSVLSKPPEITPLIFYVHPCTKDMTGLEIDVMLPIFAPPNPSLDDPTAREVLENCIPAVCVKKYLNKSALKLTFAMLFNTEPRL